MGGKVASYVSRRWPRCDEACEVDSVSASGREMPGLTTTQRFGFVWGLAGLATLMAVVFFNKIEFFPLTSMQLFTGLKTSTVVYYRVIGEYRSGERKPARLEDGVAAFRFNARYMQLVEDCFGGPAEKEICRKYLTANIAAYNKRVSPEQGLVGYEIDKLTWDFHVSDDPGHGQVADRYVLPPGESPPRSPQEASTNQ